MKRQAKRQPVYVPDRAFLLFAVCMIPVILIGYYALTQSRFEQEHPLLRALRITRPDNITFMEYSTYNLFWFGSGLLFQTTAVMYIIWKSEKIKKLNGGGMTPRWVKLCAIIYVMSIFTYIGSAEYLWGNTGCFVIPPSPDCHYVKDLVRP